MNAFGIEFSNRAKTYGADAECRAKADSQFLAFAALCDNAGVAQYVRGVDYSSNTCAFDIDVDEKHNLSEIGMFIDLIAGKTLSQYILFGYSMQKHGVIL